MSALNEEGTGDRRKEPGGGRNRGPACNSAILMLVSRGLPANRTLDTCDIIFVVTGSRALPADL